MKVEKLDKANIKVDAKLPKEDIEKSIDTIAKEVAKDANVAGFRKGKVPVKVIKKMYGDKITQDAEGEVFREFYKKCLDELDIEQDNLIGEPVFLKYEKDDDGNIDLKLKFCLKPTVDLGDYKSLIPEIKIPQVSDGEIEEELREYTKQYSTKEEIKEDKELQQDDIAVIDFEGFIDGEPFDGGKAQNYELKIGSKSFIANFEEQLIGMKTKEEKEITVRFPDDYQADDLAGKEAIFKVKLNGIKKEIEAKIDDELAKKVLKKDDATIDKFKDTIKGTLEMRKKHNYYINELKDKFLEQLVDNIDTDLPQNIVDKEIDNLLNQKAQNMSKEELENLKENKEELEKLVKEVEPDAKKSVKLTFIIDELAKKENITVSDDEVTQAIYYEAIMSGQQPADIIKKYEEAGYLPVIKMGIIENKLLTKLFDEASK